MATDPKGYFSIRIVDPNGNGYSGVEVTCFYEMIFGIPGGHVDETTDDDGYAQFPIYDDREHGTVYLSSGQVGEFDTDDSTSYSFTKDD